MADQTPEWLAYLPHGKREQAQAFLQKQQARIDAAEAEQLILIDVAERAMSDRDVVIAIANHEQMANENMKEAVDIMIKEKEELEDIIKQKEDIIKQKEDTIKQKENEKEYIIKQKEEEKEDIIKHKEDIIKEKEDENRYLENRLKMVLMNVPNLESAERWVKKFHIPMECQPCNFQDVNMPNYTLQCCTVLAHWVQRA